MTSWRDRLRPIVSAVLAAAKAAGMTPAQTRKLLRERRPCAPVGWAYKVWLDEVARQQKRRSGPMEARSAKAKRARNDAPKQGDLFDPLAYRRKFSPDHGESEGHDALVRMVDPHGALPFWFDYDGISEETVLGYFPGDQ